MATAGNAITWAKPWVYRADIYPTAPVFPAVTLGLHAAWPTGWARQKGFGNGVQLTLQKPVVAITTSDLGIVAYIPGEAHGVQMQIQFKLPTAELLQRLASFYQVSVTDADIWNFDPTDELDDYPSSEFRIGVEGRAQAGSLYDTEKIIRIILFRCQQGGNIALRLDHTGNDAGLFPTMTVQALPYTVPSGELTATGIATTDIKSDKMIWANIDPA